MMLPVSPGILIPKMINKKVGLEGIIGEMNWIWVEMMRYHYVVTGLMICFVLTHIFASIWRSSVMLI